MTNIFNLVKEYRKHLNMSQNRFGRKYGVTHSSVCWVERGKSKRIKADIIQDVLNWLGDK